MGRTNSQRQRAPQKAKTTSTKAVRIRLTPIEAEVVMDALDSWAEQSTAEAFVADDDIVINVFDAMTIADKVRSRIWLKLKKRK